MFRFLFKPLLYFLTAFLFVGCTTSGVNTVSTRDFAQSAKRGSLSRFSKLETGDTLEISVEVDGKMEVSRHRASINHFGLITLPLVGDVRVGGMAVDNARSSIAKVYGGYYVNPPVIMLSVVEDPDEGEWGNVTITGQVNRPGQVRILSADGIRLTAAIQEAGGFAASAKRSDILVTRTDQKGRKIQVNLDYNEIGQEGNAAADINLLNGDIVYVRERIF